ncbi:hypothetical protein BDC45DRAFT_449861 [Circinella umbellata]|nr:hypothetical protein BDC45DRAFT_449861 [Circinella umbellata]
MERAIENGKLTIGSKLSICGAQLSGDSQPRSPLSTSSKDTYLSITTNASRIASWDTKLGYQRHRLVFRSLSTIYENGGLVTALDVIVCRKYPLMYTETLPGSKKKIKRTAREEEDVRKRMETEIHQSMIDEEQSGWAPRFHEHEDRIVSAHFKMQLCDYHSPSLSRKNIQQKMASLLLLNANELNHMDIHEGSRYRIFFTMPYTLLDKSNNNKATSILYLKTTHKTRWENVSHVDEEKLKSTLYIPRFITTTGSLDTLEKGSEIDIAVLVLHVHTQEGRTLWYQTLLVVDPSGGLCQVKLKSPHRPVNGLEGQVIGLTNVIYEAHDPKYTIHHLRANDHSEIFIKQKIPSYMQQAILHVRQWIQK